MPAPKVSIIIPVYNGSRYLREAIDSALAQTYKNIEVIVINDGSNDNGKTENIAKSYGDRIRYFHKENGGVASALNLGISKMTGEYFSWLSHDDVYYPNKIEAQVDFLKNEKKCIVLYSDYDYIDSESTYLRTNRIGHIEPENFQLALITGWPIHGCTTFIPKRCFLECGLFDEKLRYTQDYDLWFKMAGKFQFKHIPNVLIQSRLHEEQGTLTTDSRLNYESNHLYKRFLDHLKESNINDDFIYQLLYLAGELRKKGFLVPAIHSLKLAIKLFYKGSLFTAIKACYLFLKYNLVLLVSVAKVRVKSCLSH